MSRLLFAAARGARMEMLQAPGEWVATHAMPLDPLNTMFMHRRIHPDDERMQYGPISTALRRSAANPWNSGGTWAVPHGCYWMDLSDWLLWDDCFYELHRSLFLLILAEALADEGL